MIKISSFFCSFFSKKIIFLKKKNLRQFRGTKFVMKNHIIFPKNRFWDGWKKLLKNTKISSFFDSFFLKEVIFAEIKELTSPRQKRAVRQGFETENNITRPSRAISNLRIHSFILTFRCGAAYQP